MTERVEIRPIMFAGKRCMWGLVDTTDDLVVLGAVSRPEAEDWLGIFLTIPGELEAARRNALAAAHEHVGGEIVYGEQYAARLPAPEN